MHQGVAVPIMITSCLDLSAARSLFALRTNACPWSQKLHAELVITAPADTGMEQIEKLILAKMPMRELSEGGVENHWAPSFPWKCKVPGCEYEVDDKEEEDENVTLMAAERAVKSKKGKRKWAARVKLHADAHGQSMEYCKRILKLDPLRLIVDFLHGLDINLPDKIFKFSFHDKVVLGADPDLRESLASFYAYIDCAINIAEDGHWFHGAAWHYDFCMGANGKSFGLDKNVLILALIVFGAKPGEGEDEAGTIVDEPSSRCAVENDLPGRPAKKKAKRATPPPDPLSALLRRLFGHNASKVRSIFHSFNCYAALFEVHNAPWEESSQAYADEQAERAYRAGASPVRQ